MGDRFRASMPFQCVTSHPDLLSPPPSVAWEISTGQSALIDALLLGSKGRMAHSIRGKTV